MAMTDPAYQWTTGPETMGQRLKWLRTSNRLSQEKMAELLGVPASTYATWEHDTRIRDIGEGEVARRAAEAFGIPGLRDWLLYGETQNVKFLRLVAGAPIVQPSLPGMEPGPALTLLAPYEHSARR